MRPNFSLMPYWVTMFRARAVDNQYWMLGCAPARCPEAGYVSYGNSLAVSPWGEVKARLDEKPGVLLAEVDPELNARVRQRLPILSGIRSQTE